MKASKRYRVRLVKLNGSRIIASKELFVISSSKAKALSESLLLNEGYVKYSVDIVKF